MDFPDCKQAARAGARCHALPSALLAATFLLAPFLAAQTPTPPTPPPASGEITTSGSEEADIETLKNTDVPVVIPGGGTPRSDVEDAEQALKDVEQLTLGNTESIIRRMLMQSPSGEYGSSDTDAGALLVAHEDSFVGRTVALGRWMLLSAWAFLLIWESLMVALGVRGLREGLFAIAVGIGGTWALLHFYSNPVGGLNVNLRKAISAGEDPSHGQIAAPATWPNLMQVIPRNLEASINASPSRAFTLVPRSIHWSVLSGLGMMVNARTNLSALYPSESSEEIDKAADQAKKTMKPKDDGGWSFFPSINLWEILQTFFITLVTMVLGLITSLIGLVIGLATGLTVLITVLKVALAMISQVLLAEILQAFVILLAPVMIPLFALPATRGIFMAWIQTYFGLIAYGTFTRLLGGLGIGLAEKVMTAQIMASQGIAESLGSSGPFSAFFKWLLSIDGTAMEGIAKVFTIGSFIQTFAILLLIPSILSYAGTLSSTLFGGAAPPEGGSQVAESFGQVLRTSMQIATSTVSMGAGAGKAVMDMKKQFSQ